MTALDANPAARSASAPLAWRIAAGVATLAAAAVLAWVIASWGWRWLGPAPVSSPPALATERWAEAIVAVPLFGRPATTLPAAGAGASSTGVVLQGETRLLGVFAERDGNGFALFRLADRGPVLVRAGQDVAKDVTLESVRPDGVRIRDRGEVRELSLRAPAGPAAPASTGAAPRSRTACAAPPGFRGGVYRINAELLGGMAAQADSWRALLAAANGALVVRDESGFAALLGLKAGDRLTSAGGIALATVDDMQAAVVRPLQASQPVRVTGTRDGKPLEWLLVNAAACAG